MLSFLPDNIGFGGIALTGMGIWILINIINFQSVVNIVVFGYAESISASNSVLPSVLATLKVISGIMICLGPCAILALCLLARSVTYEEDRTFWAELNATVGYYDYVSTYLLPKSDDLLIVDAMNNSDGKFVHATLVFNALQTWFGCCGVTNGYCDFMSAPYSRNSPYGLIAPVFCCKMYDPKLLQLASGGKCSDIAFRHSEYVSNYRVGCKSEIDNFVDYNASAIMGVTMGTAIVELLTALFAVILCRQGKTDYD
ncbi:uncharacterized protein LOC129590598 isoform X3 [Paramacrobiotus metropolitanus]|uniref:uncharacterized protein LOC129590598 isoform X3 n=1 Tax=Paramacrobiotus metropolitanus TaxID=2943436 RepID=UPI002445D995|nr:uncharacterized protein LOC129590598 isoform X3 [Paramacrobiotus metropolitanus]